LIDAEGVYFSLMSLLVLAEVVAGVMPLQLSGRLLASMQLDSKRHLLLAGMTTGTRGRFFLITYFSICVVSE